MFGRLCVAVTSSRKAGGLLGGCRLLLSSLDNWGLVPIVRGIDPFHPQQVQESLGRKSPWQRKGRSFSTTVGGHHHPQKPPPSASSSTQHEQDGQQTFSDFNDMGSSSGSNFDKDQQAEEEFQIKLKILGASLNHVNTMGWTTDALRAGAADLSLSDAIASLCTPFDLVEYFQLSANWELANHLKGLDKKDKSLYSSLEYRLKLVVPYIDRYHQAMGLSLEPVNVPKSLQVLRDLSDTVCINGLGDSSTDLRWYTKRTGILSLFVSTECCMVQDKSEGFQETWKFLERRVKDYEFFETAGSTALPFLESGFTTVMNILGMNRRR